MIVERGTDVDTGPKMESVHRNKKKEANRASSASTQHVAVSGTHPGWFSQIKLSQIAAETRNRESFLPRKKPAIRYCTNNELTCTIPSSLVILSLLLPSNYITLQIADLGSAQTLEQAKRDKEAAGTFAWMAPEV